MLIDDIILNLEIYIKINLCFLAKKKIMKKKLKKFNTVSKHGQCFFEKKIIFKIVITK